MMRRLMIAAVVATGLVAGSHTAHAKVVTTTSCLHRMVWIDSESRATWAHECVVQTHKGSKPKPETLSPRLWPSVTRWAPYIFAAAHRTGIPADIIGAVIEQESGGDPSVWSYQADGIAVGLLQYGPAEAAIVRGAYTYDPAGNIMTGALFLRWTLDHCYGHTIYAMLAHYNGGCYGWSAAYADQVLSRI